MLWCDIEKAPAWSPAQPFQNTAAVEIDTQTLHIHGNDSDGVESIQRHQRTDLLRFLADGGDIHDARRLEQNMRDRDEPRLLVYGVDQPLRVDCDAVIGWHDLDGRAEPCRQRIVRISD